MGARTIMWVSEGGQSQSRVFCHQQKNCLYRFCMMSILVYVMYRIESTAMVCRGGPLQESQVLVYDTSSHHDNPDYGRSTTSTNSGGKTTQAEATPTDNSAAYIDSRFTAQPPPPRTQVHK